MTPRQMVGITAENACPLTMVEPGKSRSIQAKASPSVNITIDSISLTFYDTEESSPHLCSPSSRKGGMYERNGIIPPLFKTLNL